MGVDTKAKLTSNPTYIEVMEMLKSLNEVSNVKIEILEEPQNKSYFKDGEKIEYFDEGICRIGFIYKNTDGVEEKRSICLIPTKDTHKDDIPFVSEKYLWCSLGMWGSSVEIMTKIVKSFGGFIIPNDCEDEYNKDFFIAYNTEKNKIFKNETIELFNSLNGVSITNKIEIMRIIENNSELFKTYINKL